MTDDERTAAVQAELARPEDERLLTLGRAMRPPGLGADEQDADDVLAEDGARFVEQLAARLRGQICGSVTIRMACEKGEGSDAGLILPLVDIVATVLSGPPIFTATATLISRGIARYCAADWRPHE